MRYYFLIVGVRVVAFNKNYHTKAIRSFNMTKHSVCINSTSEIRMCCNVCGYIDHLHTSLRTAFSTDSKWQQWRYKTYTYTFTTMHVTHNRIETLVNPGKWLTHDIRAHLYLERISGVSFRNRLTISHSPFPIQLHIVCVVYSRYYTLFHLYNTESQLQNRAFRFGLSSTGKVRSRAFALHLTFITTSLNLKNANCFLLNLLPVFLKTTRKNNIFPLDRKKWIQKCTSLIVVTNANFHKHIGLYEIIRKVKKKSNDFFCALPNKSFIILC